MTDETLHRGDIWVTYTGGKTRYVRIGDPRWDTDPTRTYVQDVDGAGFLLGNNGRYLRTNTLHTRYRLHYRQDSE